MEKNFLTVFTDGGARGNPGPAAIGIYVLKGKNQLLKFGKRIGETTNNVAEYTALIEALAWIKNNLDFKRENISHINFFLDSKLIANQLNGIFKVKEAHLRELVITVRTLENEIGGNISYKYIPREKNSIADSLVNSSFV